VIILLVIYDSVMYEGCVAFNVGYGLQFVISHYITLKLFKVS